MAGEVVVAGKLVDDGLEIGRGLRASQEGCSNRSDGLGPRLEVVPAGNGRDGLAVQETTTKAERWERLMPKREAASEASIAPELKLSRVRWTSSLASRWPIWRFLHGVIQAQRQGAVPTVGMAGCQGSVGELRCKKPVAQAPGPMSHRAAGPPDPEASGSQAGRSAARVARARGDHGQPKGPGKRAARSG